VSETTPERLGRGTILALAAMCLCIFLIANDFTALTVALPAIESELDTSLNRVQWVINGYTVIFGVLIVTGGRLADMFGRKRFLLIGAAVFAGFSLLGGLAPSIEVLIVARALMGIGGALLWPAALGLIYVILPDDKAGFAGGLVLGIAGIGNAFGPLLGGLLTDVLSWRWVFFLNVPIAVLAMVVTYRQVSESLAPGERHIDYRGIATLSAGVILLLVGLDQGTASGYGSAVIVAMFVVSAVLLVAFAFVERDKGEVALLPHSVIANRQFAGACAAVMLLSASFFAIALYLPQFMEKQLEWSAVAAGLGLLPFMAVFAATSFVAGPLYDRLGARRALTIGAACIVVGILALSFLDASIGYTSLVPGMIVAGVGVGLFYSAVTTTAVTAIDPSQASLAGGIVYMSQIAAGSIGLGLTTAIVLAQSDLVDGIANAFRFDAALGALAVAVVLRYIGDDQAKAHHHLDLKRHHRAHG
jgi:EmrB/QacA subfamily drug resistance transporter